MKASIASNLERLHAGIASFCDHNGRRRPLLVAVSKSHSAAAIREAWQCGQRDFAENYWQEAREKIALLSDIAVIWHFIGRIQRNKAGDIARAVHWVHSVDRFGVAQRLNDQRPDHLPALQVCIQVNTDGEIQKGGVAPEQTGALAEDIARLPRLNLRGLMVIGSLLADEQSQKRTFQTLSEQLTELQQELPGQSLDTLSMGMSKDWKQAVLCGSTMIRVGRSIFGRR